MYKKIKMFEKYLMIEEISIIKKKDYEILFLLAGANKYKSPIFEQWVGQCKIYLQEFNLEELFQNTLKIIPTLSETYQYNCMNGKNILSLLQKSDEVYLMSDSEKSALIRLIGAKMLSGIIDNIYGGDFYGS